MKKGCNMTETKETTPYDDVFLTQTVECPKLLIPVINETFHENYDGSEIVIQTENEIFLRKQDGYEEKRITDASLQVKRENEDKGKSYHLECQSTKDKSMAVRMYEYDTQIALKDKEWVEDTLIVRFPNSAILYLRSDEKVKKEITMVIETSGGSVSYQIPLIKMKDYSLETIFSKHLYFLLPFWIFVHEDELKKYEQDKDEREKLVKEFVIIINRLQEDCERGIIDEYTKCMLVDMTKKVIRNLLGNKYPKVKDEVEKVMGGKVLEFEARTIKNQGREEGRLEGRREERKQHLIECICKKLRKGKDIAIIAEELEEEVSTIEKIYEVAREFAPEYDVEAILKAEKNN